MILYGGGRERKEKRMGSRQPIFSRDFGVVDGRVERWFSRLSVSVYNETVAWNWNWKGDQTK